MLKIFAKPYS